MAQNLNVEFENVRYTRTDFTALRAHIQRIELGKIRDLYYGDEAPQVLVGLEKFLTKMRHDLIERAVLANPQLAENLSKARLGGPISLGVLDVLIKAADAKPSQPVLADPIAQWFRPATAAPLISQRLKNISDLRGFMLARGPSWWRPIPRIGQLRARVIERWLNRYEATALPSDFHEQAQSENPSELAVLNSAPLPLERIGALPPPLSGSAGLNRHQDFCYIQARNDLDAIRSYLADFTDRPHTYRAYAKELERLLLWCTLVRGVPLSGMLVEDCQAYKAFLAAPSPSFCGLHRRRNSPLWRPFEGPLAPTSRAYAVQVLRTAFAWLHSVRYLAGNPWVAVRDPLTVTPHQVLQIGRAFSEELWSKLRSALDALSVPPENHQFRLGRAALLLIGVSGIRRAEAASAQASLLEQSGSIWQLQVLGKRSKWRTVPLSNTAVEALQAHWSDLALHRPECLNENNWPKGALLQPIVIPGTSSGRARHERAIGLGYSDGGLALLIKTVLSKVAARPEFSSEESTKLLSASAHSFRHTFGTLMANRSMPIKQLQDALGHSSLNTTSIYTNRDVQKMLQEAAKAYQD